MEGLLPWFGVIFIIVIFLAIDLGVFNRVPHAISMREAFEISLAWVALSMLFNIYVWYAYGSFKALEFFTGYILEKLLSLDNMFVFVMLFQFFAIPARHQHRILFWGIVGAVIFRLLFILIGIQLIEAFDWILYVFGAILIYSGYKMYQERDKPLEVESNKIILWAKKILPLDETYKGRRFFLLKKGKWVATRLFLVLLTIEVTDIIFALDSIPAIFAITLDPFIVFSSNIFAILGLRSMYFLLANVIQRFYYLQHALAIILGFVGIKLALTHHMKIPLMFSLTFITVVLGVAILASLKRKE